MIEFDTHEQSLENMHIGNVTDNFADSHPAADSSSGLAWVISIAMCAVGMVLIVLANGEAGVVVLAPVYFVLGIVLFSMPGISHSMARRAYLLSFSVCVLTAGACQLYSLAFFGDVQSTRDAVTVFYPSSREGFGSLKQLVNAPMAVYVWQFLYAVCGWLRLGNGPWIAVLWNSFLVGSSAALTVLAGRYVWGEDAARLRRLGTMFASYGVFWLFGALHVRDSWALFFNVLLMWGFLRVLAKPNLGGLVLLVLIVAAVTEGMLGIRESYVLLMGAICLLGILMYLGKGNKVAVLLILPVMGILAIACYTFLSEYAAEALGTAEVYRERYGSGAAELTQSLGAALVVRQVLPIRVFTGMMYLLINPIPLWVSFVPGLLEYNWLMGFGGIFLVLVLPRTFLGFARALKDYFSEGAKAVSLGFLSMFALLGTLGVVVSSLETRHFAPFVPALLLLACLPDKRDPGTRSRLAMVSLFWFLAIVLGHGMWASLKIF